MLPTTLVQEPPSGPTLLRTRRSFAPKITAVFNSNEGSLILCDLLHHKNADRLHIAVT
jgi:hypothetical protein